MGNKIKDGMNGGGHGNVPDHIYKQVTNNVVGGGYGNKSGGPNSWGSPGGPGQPAYGSAEYWQQYQQYQQQYQQWHQHHQQQPPPSAAPQQQQGSWNQSSSDASQEDINSAWNTKPEVLVVRKGGLLEGRLDEEVDHKKHVQVDLENVRSLDRSADLWSSLEESGWYCSSPVAT